MEKETPKLCGLDLREGNENGELENCVFDGLNMPHTRFGNMRGVRFVDSILDNAEFEGLIENTNFSDASLIGSHFSSTYMDGVVFQNALLKNAYFEANGAAYSAVCFCDSNLTNAVFKDIDIEYSCFQNANLVGVTFDNCNIDKDTILHGAIIDDGEGNLYELL